MIIVRLSGGMGNQMFQYAMGRALSIKHNVPLKLDTTFLLHRVRFISFLRPKFVFRDFDLDVFAIDVAIVAPQEIGWWNRPFLWGMFMVGFDALLRKLAFLPGWEKSFTVNDCALSYGPDTYLVGFWQSEKYFASIASTIRNDFTLRDQLPLLSEELNREIETTQSVCIHVRRSDIALLSFHGDIDMQYYTEGLAHIEQKVSIDKLYVFSDDIEWCKANLTFAYPTTFVGQEYAGKKQVGHLMLMRACKHFIIANSTFSWWAAWLGNHPEKIVIAPKKWFGDADIDDRDLIPENWIRI